MEGNMKKIIALAGAGILLASMVTPVFGWYLFSSDVAIVDNSAIASSWTGGNTQNATANMFSGVNASGFRYMRTGNAGSQATAVTVANTHVGCDSCGFEGVSHEDVALVGNDAVVMSDTGDNHQNVVGSFGSVNAGGGRIIRTGNAWSRASAWTVVNTHLSF